MDRFQNSERKSGAENYFFFLAEKPRGQRAALAVYHASSANVTQHPPDPPHCSAASRSQVTPAPGVAACAARAATAAAAASDRDVDRFAKAS